ncbi:YlzJ-like family protein [Pueribacillus sp. YX66]|uniref:YlzJ-like family protein n=1 Tax=Pueribacillus sp. YX66 TaxID=3229242 RepID=UPI00358D8E02
MILYTVVPQEDIFSTGQLQEQNKEMTVAINNVQLVVQQKEDKWEIIRLISSDPNDYLNEHYQPGQLLSFKPYLQ